MTDRLADPVERVARTVWSKRNSCLWENAWSGDTSRLMGTVADTLEALTEQGIPIEQLLSGEMVAINQWPGVTQEEADSAAMGVWEGRLALEEWRKSRAERDA